MLKEGYIRNITSLINKIIETQSAKIEEAAAKIADSLMKGGILHVFGSGHSAMIGKELVQRAGGLVPVNLVHDPTEGMAERVQGYGRVLLEHYGKRYGLQAGEVMIVVSTSGRNPLPIEIAMEAKAHGLFTIAITSVEYSRLVSSRHSSGKRLFEVVDLTLDTGVPFGDALIEVPGLGQKAGPASTVLGALLANMLVLQVIEEIIKRGGVPPILMSQNLDGADEHNQALEAKYRHRLAW
jgi:uncharacterized phosphosugar-binding protein